MGRTFQQSGFGPAAEQVLARRVDQPGQDKFVGTFGHFVLLFGRVCPKDGGHTPGPTPAPIFSEIILARRVGGMSKPAAHERMLGCDDE
jgi:hypothetical protein